MTRDPRWSVATLRAWILRAWDVVFAGRRDTDLEEELRTHLALAAEDDAGRRRATPDAARARALRAGTVASAMDAMRDQRGVAWLDALARDARHAGRALRRQPGFTAVVLVTLAAGLGANIAIFTVVNGVLIAPLPYPSADRLVGVWQVAPGAPGLATGSGDLRLSASMFMTYAEHNRTFDAFGVWYADSAVVTGAGAPEPVRTVVVSDGTLQALGVAPILGRPLSAADQGPRAPEVVLLGYGYWQQRFGAATDVVGRALRVDGRPREIVGVMPPGFAIATDAADLVVPIGFDRSRTILPGFGYQGVARLKAGVTIAEADADLARLVPIWMRSWPAAPGVDPLVYERWRIAPALRPFRQDVVGPVERPLWLLTATVGFVLLIACANVASLLLARADGRQHELAVRAALGAGRARVVRALVVESLLLSTTGGLLGVLVAEGALRWLVAAAPADLPRLSAIAIDPVVLIYAGAISILSGLLFGVAPALKATRPDIHRGLRSQSRAATEGRERQRARSQLVIAQVALASALLVAAGLMLRTFDALRTVAPGFTNASEEETLQLSFPEALIPDPDRVARTQQAIVGKIRALAGVDDVAFASALPMDGAPPDWDDLTAEHKASPDGDVPPFRFFKSVSPAFFETMGTRLIAGREYSWTDLFEHRPVVIVSDNLAREFWGSASAALGRRVRTLDVSPWREVIGVVQGVSERGVQAAPPAAVYWPSFGESAYRAGTLTVARNVTIVVRSARASSANFLDEIRQAVWAVNRDVPIANPQTMEAIHARSMSRTSFTLVLLGVAAALGLFLGVVGLYGVIAYDISRRAREIGIRVALGAAPIGIERMFVRQGLSLSLAGLVLGAAVAAGLTHLMSSLIFGVSPIDPATYAFVAGTLLVTTAGASYLAAHRAASIDPASVFRSI